MPAMTENTPSQKKKYWPKKFHRYFPKIDQGERVLKHYFCSLMGDMPLRGTLYITENYFAFYSNIFGYVTKLLIPVMTVDDITKEQTARILPNAIGIVTGKGKLVFRMASRDSRLKFMRAVCEKAKTAKEELVVADVDMALQPDLSGSEYGDVESDRESPAPEISPTRPTITGVARKMRSKFAKNSNECPVLAVKGARGLARTLKEAIAGLKKLPKQSLMVAAMLLVILMFLSASVFLYRISKMQNRVSMALGDKLALIDDGDDVCEGVWDWMKHLHSTSSRAAETFLYTNLDQIAKERQAIEALSTLIRHKSNNNENDGLHQQQAESDQS